MNLVIKKLSTKKIKDVVNLHRLCIRISNSKYYPQYVIKEWIKEVTEENIKKQIKNSKWIVAYKDQKLVAFAQYSLKESYLYQINVRPEEQRKKIGKNMYSFIENIFLKSGKETIKLNATLNSINFYKGLGFEEVKKNLYELNSKKVEMLFMVKKLI